jgi:hypothetical protein
VRGSRRPPRPGRGGFRFAWQATRDVHCVVPLGVRGLAVAHLFVETLARPSG